MKPEYIDRMEHMHAQGCIVALILNRTGWCCTITDPVVSGTGVGSRATPDEAVLAAHERWEAKVFPPDEGEKAPEPVPMTQPTP